MADLPAYDKKLAADCAAESVPPAAGIGEALGKPKLPFEKTTDLRKIVKEHFLDQAGTGAIYQHKNGNLYQIVSEGLIEASQEPCIIYRAMSDGRVWVLTKTEFFDGRFVLKSSRIGTGAQDQFDVIARQIEREMWDDHANIDYARIASIVRSVAAEAGRKARLECLQAVLDHKKTIGRKRDTTFRFAAPEVQQEIQAEERGEMIAVEIIMKAIRATMEKKP